MITMDDVFPDQCPDKRSCDDPPWPDSQSHENTDDTSSFPSFRPAHFLCPSDRDEIVDHGQDDDDDRPDDECRGPDDGLTTDRPEQSQSDITDSGPR